MQLQVQQPDLAQMFGQDSLYSTLYGLQRQDQANAAQTQNLGQAQQDQNFQAQNQPATLEGLIANNRHTNALAGQAEAQTPGMVANSNILTRNDADQGAVPENVRRQALISKAAASTTEDNLKQHIAKATMDLTATLPNGQPDLLTRKNAQLVIDTAPEIQNELRKVAAQGENSARVAGITSGAMVNSHQMDIDAGKFNKNSMEYLKFMANAKANFQQQAGIAQKEAEDYSAAAQQTTDPEEKAFYTSKAQEALKTKNEAVLNDYRAKQAAGTAGNAAKPDLNSLGIPTVVNQGNLPAPPVAQVAGPLPKATTTGGKTWVIRPDGASIQVDNEDLQHLPSGWKRK